MIAKRRPAWQWFIWILIIVLLPLTSFPPAARLMQSSMVAPASILAVLVFAITWFLPYLFRRHGLSPHTKIIFIFAAVSIISTLLAVFLPLPIFREIPVLRNSIEGMVTLAIGIGFFVMAATWPVEVFDLRRTLTWINWSGAIIIAWCAVQAGIWYLTKSYPEWLIDLQNIFSTSGNLYHQRVTGLAYEPSWLAHQLNMLYLPIWFSATVFRFTAHSRRLGIITFENILFAGGLATLFFSFSRIGWLAFLASAAFALLLLNIRLIQWLQRRFVQRKDIQQSFFQKALLSVILLVLLLALYLALFLGAGFVLSKLDPRMTSLFDLDNLNAESFTALANRLVFAERVVFWDVGWKAFGHYPWLGVGLGNSGYFFPEELSSFAWGLPEVRNLMYHQSHIPNTKNLWVRLLSETGVVGFSIFIAWLFSLWQTGGALKQHGNSVLGVFGLAGQLALVAFVVEGFSLDTFALPYYWMLFGLLVAAYQISARREDKRLE